MRTDIFGINVVSERLNDIALSLPGVLFRRYTTLYAVFVDNLVIYEVFGTDSRWNVPQIIPTHSVKKNCYISLL